MDAAGLIGLRLRSHRLSAPAATVTAAAAHMLAIQAQEFWGGRWALAARTSGAPLLSDVDACFDRGELVRTWTMRGTIHVIPARDVGWVLGVTGPRQLQAGAGVRRREGIDDAESARAERLARAALRGGGALTRAELFDAFEAGGVVTAGQRGYHLLTVLSMRGVIVQGPVVAREGAPSREQRFVLLEDWIGEQAQPADPLAHFFTRFVHGHGPAGASDFAWWAGLPLGVAREAATRAADGLRQVDDLPEPRYIDPSTPRRRSTAAEVIALPPFEEYYISYADRTAAVDRELLPAIGPGTSGMVRPILVARGRIVGVWRHSLAVGSWSDAPSSEIFDRDAVVDDEVRAALDRYARFITG